MRQSDRNASLVLAELAATSKDPAAVREAILARAVQAGKITAGSLELFRQQYERDRTGTVALLAAFAPGFAHSAFARAAMAEQAEAELLAGARAAFPELERHGRKSSRGSSAPPSRAHLPTTGVGSKDSQAVSPPAIRAGWYRRENGQPVRKGIQRSRSPLWPTVLADPTGPAPFPAGLEVS